MLWFYFVAKLRIGGKQRIHKDRRKWRWEKKVGGGKG